MNIQNITALASQLQSLGFDNLGSLVLKRICFKPDNFYLNHKIAKDKELLEFRFYFERQRKSDAYMLLYYDITLQQKDVFEELMIAGINIADLEKQMTTISWMSAFNLDERKKLDPNDKTTWEVEAKVETVVESLASLEQDEKGKAVAAALKVKFWLGTPYHEIFGSIPAVKNKSDISQRFYFSENSSGITVDEAYRFLQNKWLEKQLQLKKKQADSNSESEIDETNGTTGSGLLKKRRINPSLKGKRNKANQD
ncbi:hypothetical protein IQ13_3448 [Lacibacter cauensis]|uniref:Uncharacterized protein n=1 Tax=Lacibacter cauensis TaxID=510947 RepID=A0A562SE36_9BACT|nr:hypothetical protein [Lacibacter cauensis]TWI79056.1 hypothetical protein IQ13_3448 [Lacibacter cauensis]